MQNHNENEKSKQSLDYKGDQKIIKGAFMKSF